MLIAPAYQRIKVVVCNGCESWLTTESKRCSMLVQGAYRYSKYIRDLCPLKRKLAQIQNLLARDYESRSPDIALFPLALICLGFEHPFILEKLQL